MFQKAICDEKISGPFTEKHIPSVVFPLKGTDFGLTGKPVIRHF